MTVNSEESSLASQCLAFCQALASQGQAFSFSLTIGSSFTFSLDTRGKEPVTPEVTRKRPSPSTLRRNARRRQEFLKKKSPSPPNQTSEDLEPNLLKCQQCDQQFTSEHTLRSHVRKTHTIIQQIDGANDSICDSIDTKNNVSGNNSVKCVRCDHMFPSQAHLEFHHASPYVHPMCIQNDAIRNSPQ